MVPGPLGLHLAALGVLNDVDYGAVEELNQF